MIHVRTFKASPCSPMLRFATALYLLEIASAHRHYEIPKRSLIRTRHHGSTAASSMDQDLMSSDADPSSFKGCKKVFFDVGSNVGVHVRRIFEPELYPSSPYLKILDKTFGSPEERRTDKSLCAFGIEANPKWTNRLKDIEESYGKMGWRAKWFAPSAASNVDGQTVSLEVSSDGASNDWGASVHSGGGDGMVKVTTLDIGTLIKTGIDAARRGDPRSGQEGKTDAAFRTLMKMDIEGSEYTVLAHMLELGVLCKSYINTLTIEWHDWKLPENSSTATKLKAALADPSRCPLGEITEILEVDDESYLYDRATLPSTNSWCYKSSGAYAQSCSMFTWTRLRFFDEAAFAKCERRVVFIGIAILSIGITAYFLLRPKIGPTWRNKAFTGDKQGELCVQSQ
eukprot:TRINITY_DN2184_c0_g1_i14.p1 TRINITY_DN2184_c0_g1~~TRINITY_DN2184_c0_g1_i14.p1  ORF type:complete len:398 (+),score=55.72 TRINITY_DN2184_c0_g1_i14:28-1221(+)